MIPRWTTADFEAHVKALSVTGWRLALWEDGAVWRWEWKQGGMWLDGSCDAKTKQLAFFCAVESLS